MFRDERKALDAKLRAQEAEIESLRARLEQAQAGASDRQDAEELGEENAQLRSLLVKQRAQNEKDAWTGTYVLIFVVFPAVLVLLGALAYWLSGR